MTPTGLHLPGAVPGGAPAAGGQAVVPPRLAIARSAVGALVGRPARWWIGLAFGAAGLLYSGDGSLLVLRHRERP